MIHPLELRAFRGPNRHASTPLVFLRVDIGAVDGRPTDPIPGLADRLLSELPRLREHGCCLGQPGGLERLEAGTWFGHLLEHVALELQRLAGYGAARVPARTARTPGTYDVLFSYDDEEVGLEAARVALAYLCSLLPPALVGDVAPALLPVSLEVAERVVTVQPSIDVYTSCFLAYAKRRQIGPSTKSIVDEAKRRNIPVQRIGDKSSSVYQLGWGAASRQIQATITGNSSYLAVELAQDKRKTATRLGAYGLPVPKQSYAYSPEEAVAAAIDIGYPVVVKPADLSKGRGIGLNLRSADAVTAAFDVASKLSSSVLVETFLPGRDYRILVVGDRVVAAAERIPAHVVGDGVHSIEQLVELVNQDLRRGDGHENVLTKLELGPAELAHLFQADLRPESVPAAGQACFLCTTANLSTGGTAIDRTDEMHPDNRIIAVRAARQIGLDVAGIDLVCPDIAKSVHVTGGGIVEVNAAPGFRMHLAPSDGKPRDVAGAVVDHLLGGTQGRIPLVAVTGTNGKTTTVKMMAHILSSATGRTVGHTCSEGIYVGDSRIAAGDCSGPQSARILLGDRGVDALVLETARGGLIREGLAFDACDVGCVLNVTADHLGLRGIDTVEQLAELKSVVVQSVKSLGTSVLNADDALCRQMADIAGGRVFWFSLENSDFARERIARGERVAVYEGGNLVIYEGLSATFVALATDLPATMNGTARFNIANALAASAMAWSLGIPVTEIRRALQGFSSSVEENPGRLNVVGDGLPYQVVVDYAHNEAALRAVSDFVVRQPHRRSIAVLMSAGDRRDEDIRNMGRIAAESFDVLIAKEHGSRRGRAVGDQARLMMEGARSAGMGAESIFQAMSDDSAVELAFQLAEPGDIVLLCVEDAKGILDRVAREKVRWAARDERGDGRVRARPIDESNGPLDIIGETAREAERQVMAR